MAFWVYGKDAKSGEPAEMFSDADTPEAARDEATAQGITVDRVQEHADAKAPPNREADPRFAAATAKVSPRPEYEFTAEQNRIIGDLASKMRFVGLFLILGGALLCLGVVVGHFGGLISGVVYILLGVWTRSAGASFRRIVETEGKDIS